MILLYFTNLFDIILILMEILQDSEYVERSLGTTALSI